MKPETCVWVIYKETVEARNYRLIRIASTLEGSVKLILTLSLTLGITTWRSLVFLLLVTDNTDAAGSQVFGYFSIRHPCP